MTSRRRVLLVSYHFPPSVGGGVPRLASFARVLPSLGWDVTVLTSPVHGRAGLDPAPLAALPASVRVVRAYCPFAGLGVRGHQRATRGTAATLTTFVRAMTHAVLVPDREAIWAGFATRAAHAVLRETPHDAVLASYGPGSNLVVGMRVARRHGLPWVLDYRDLWSDLPHATHASAAHAALITRIDRRAATRATKITTVSPGMTEHVSARFHRTPGDVVTITNGFDDDDVTRVHDARTSGPRPLELLYAGSVYGAYDFGPFFVALREALDGGALDPTRVRVRFVGNMPQDEPARRGVSAVCTVESFVSRSAVFDKMASADAMIVIEGGGYWSRFGYPVKVFDYLLTGKPVLGLVEPGGNTARLLDAMGERHTSRPDDVAGIRRALENLVARGPQPPRAVDTIGGPLAPFRRTNAIKRLASVLDEAVAIGPRRAHEH